MPPNLPSPPQADTAARPASGGVLRRSLAARATGVAALPVLLDACLQDGGAQDGGAQDGRAYITFGNGIAAGALHPDGAPGCALPPFWPSTTPSTRVRPFARHSAQSAAATRSLSCTAAMAATITWSRLLPARRAAGITRRGT